VTLYGEPTTTTSVTPLANGGFVVRWLGVIDGAVINRVQAYDATANAVGTPFESYAQTEFGTTRALVFALPDGGYVVTLQSAIPANQQLFVYDNDGNPVGEVRMHDAGDGTGHSTLVLANRPNGDTLVESLAFGEASAIDNITIQTIRFEGTVPVIEANQTGGTADFSAAILPVRVSIPDPDGSEIVQSLVISGVPAGWTLTLSNATATLNAGVWTVTGPGIAQGGAIDLRLTAPAGTTGSGTLSVVAHTIDTDNGSESESFPASYDFAHLPVNKPVPFDVNGDGTSDVLWRHTNGFVAEWQMNAGGIVDSLGIGMPSLAYHFQDTGDFNGDGSADILWRHDNGQVVMVELNGNQIILNQAVATPGNSWHNEGAGDLTGDGKSDILWRHDNGQLALWQMDGPGIVSNRSIAAPGNDWHVQGLLDAGGDGKSDVLLRHDSGQVVLWTMDGAQISSNQAIANVGLDWNIAGTGDFNGDGKGDILWRHDSGQVALWEMDGANIVSNQSIATPSNAWHIKDVGDYNADGLSDVLWRHDSGQVAVWEMDGATITDNHAVATPSSDWTILNHRYDLL
jgi:hypothetical protein